MHGETPDHIKNHRLLKGVTIPRTGQTGILGTLSTKTLVICGDAGLFTDETGRKGGRFSGSTFRSHGRSVASPSCCRRTACNSRTTGMISLSMAA